MWLQACDAVTSKPIPLQLCGRWCVVLSSGNSSTQIEGVSLYYYVHLLFLRFIFAVNWHCCVLVILLLLIISSIVIIIIFLLLFSCIVPAFTETFCRAEILYTAYCVIYFYYWLKTYHIKCRWWPNIEWLRQVCLFVIISLSLSNVEWFRCCDA